MKSRLLALIDALRDAGLPVTVAETLDAMQAVGVLGVERTVFRDGLAAALVKDEADRPAFEALFDRFFAAPRRERGKGERPQHGRQAGGHGPAHTGVAPRATPKGNQPPRPMHEQRTARQREDAPRHEEAERHRQLARRRMLQTMPIHEMSTDEIEECDALLAELARRFRAHLARRTRGARRGRLDVRRTLRRSMSTGGVPIEPAFRQRRLGRPDLLTLCDHSYSVATATHFLLALLAPAYEFFRRVRVFAFVDQPVEVSLESGMVVPHEPLDLYARSDFGKVLVAFRERHESLLTRNTLFLILGDGRNNRRPPRADILARIHSAVRQVVWLNPEPMARWNTGDSVMRTYVPHCDTVLASATIYDLYAALRQAF